MSSNQSGSFERAGHQDNGRICFPHPTTVLSETQHFVTISKPAGVSTKDNNGRPALVLLNDANKETWVPLLDDLPKQVPGIVWALQPSASLHALGFCNQAAVSLNVYVERTFQCLVAGLKIPDQTDLERLLRAELAGQVAGQKEPVQEKHCLIACPLGEKLAESAVTLAVDMDEKLLSLLSVAILQYGSSAEGQLAIVEVKVCYYLPYQDVENVHAKNGRRLDGRADAASVLMKALKQVGLPVVGKGSHCRPMRGVTGKFFVATELSLKCILANLFEACVCGVHDANDIGRLADLSLCALMEFPRLARVFESETMHATSVMPKLSKIPTLQKLPHLSEEDMTSCFEEIIKVAKFRPFNGHGKLDFKVKGERSLQLGPPYTFLQPMVSVMTDLANKSLHDDEQLAILQLILNLFEDNTDSIKPHRHRCRQICVSLGASRELDVAGQRLTMSHGDALYLEGEYHSVPPTKHVSRPRVSVCLFYGSAEEYESKSIMVNDVDDLWWSHPDDLISS